MEKNMTRWELLTLLLAIKTLVEENKGEKALSLIDEVITEIKKNGWLGKAALMGRLFLKCKCKNANEKMKMQSANCKLQIEKCKLQIEKWICPFADF